MVTIVDTQEERLAILRQMREERLDQLVIYSLDKCSDEKWLDMLKNAWVLTILEKGKPKGIGWFDNIHGKTAQSHYCMFRNSFKDAQECGQAVINWLVDKLGVTMLTCISPKPYRQSTRLLQAWGYKEVLLMPEACYIAKYNKSTDGILYVRRS